MSSSAGAGDPRKGHSKDEDEDDHIHLHLDKNTVLQECRIFNKSDFVSKHPKRCCMQLTRVLYLLAQGETLTMREAEDVFFGATKLFQTGDGNLRRMVCLFLKEVARYVDPAYVLIVTSSLQKDMTEPEMLVRANSIRVLGTIVDASTLTSVDRYLQAAIVSDSAVVAQAALSAGYGLLRRPNTGDAVRRWVGEIQQALQSRDAMIQYHALVLLHAVKRTDKLAISRLLTGLMRGGATSDLALVMLLRYTAALLRTDLGAMDPRTAFGFLEKHLHHRNEMVSFEAVRAIASLPGAAERDVEPAVHALFELLGHARPAVRFGAVRTLSDIAEMYPGLVSTTNADLELLISDPNRTIATYAITTLLRVGDERSVDKLLKRIGAFLVDLGDEFKTVVVRAVHALALRMPRKTPALMLFLSNGLREEGGIEFKRAIVEALIDLSERLPRTRVEALFHLCEFIEDCEFTALSVRVLHYLGDAGPATRAPASFIRFVYNRVILENAAVRAAAVSTLAKFAARVPSVRAPVVALLARCQGDEDDEVRDRATLALDLLRRASKPSPPNSSSSSGGAAAPSSPSPSSASSEALRADPSVAPADKDDVAVATMVSVGTLPMPASALRRALQMYQLRPAAGAFRFDALPRVPLEEDERDAVDASSGEVTFASVCEATSRKLVRRRAAAEAAAAAGKALPPGRAAAAGEAAAAAAAAAAGGGDGAGGDPLRVLYEAEELGELGALVHSCPPQSLTEMELEYLVKLTRHVFADHTVLDFAITNTVPDVALSDVIPSVELSGVGASEYEVTAVVPAKVVRAERPAHAFVCLRRTGSTLGTVSVAAELKFRACDVDPETGEFDPADGEAEDYALEDFELSPRHLVRPEPVAGFRAAWEAAGRSNESFAELARTFDSVPNAVSAIVRAVGLAPSEGTGEVRSGVTKHQVLLAGTMPDNSRVLGRLQVLMHPTRGCLMRIGFRSSQLALSRAFLALIP